MKPVLYTGFLATVSLAASSGYYKKEDVQVEVPKFPEADLDALYRSGGSFKGAKRAEFGAIRDAQETILTPTRSIDSLFLRLPSAT